jgi:hypothetical protein
MEAKVAEAGRGDMHAHPACATQQALEEIERLLAGSTGSGKPAEPWLRELASELRKAVETEDAERIEDIIGRITARPAASFRAHAGLAELAERVLRSEIRLSPKG